MIMIRHAIRAGSALAVLALLGACGQPAPKAADVAAPAVAAATEALTPAEAKAIAHDAWLYAYAPIQGYQTMYNQTQNKAFPGYVGGFNRYRHYARIGTPADKDIVTPNNDTPYSWAWLDLRAEPMVLSLPAEPKRYYVNQWFDMFTHNFAYTGSRATGHEAGNYLFVGPNWIGEVPKGINKVFRSETDFVGTLTRTALDGPEDLKAMQALQAQYKLTPLSTFAGTPAPTAAPAVDWPVWDKAKAEGIGFIGYLNALLPFVKPVPSEAAVMERFARIGIGAGKPFDPATLDPDIRAAMEAGIAEAAATFQAKAQKEKSATAFFGSRQELGPNYIYNRSAGAALGIYGNSKEEAVYSTQQTGPDGKILDGRKNWTMRFEPGKLPPVKEFWSISMYNLPERFLVANPINRYSIGSRTKGLKTAPDGSLTLYLQNKNPGPDKQSNWLPTPAAPFFFAGRFYGPKQEAIDGTWVTPPLVEAK